MSFQGIFPFHSSFKIYCYRAVYNYPFNTSMLRNDNPYFTPNVNSTPSFLVSLARDLSVLLIFSDSQCMHACMLSRFSHVSDSVIPWTAPHQAPLSMGFSRQEYWSGLPFPSPQIVNTTLLILSYFLFLFDFCSYF